MLDETRHLEDSVAIVFDRPDERQIVFERMDWSHPNRRGYYEKNKAFIAAAPSPLRDVLTEDPIQVMFNGSVEPMRALVAALRAMPIADRFSVAVTEYVPRDFSLVDVNGAGCSKGTTLARWATRRGLTPRRGGGGRRQPERRRDARLRRHGVRHGQRHRSAQIARLPPDRDQRRRRAGDGDPGSVCARFAEFQVSQAPTRPYSGPEGLGAGYHGAWLIPNEHPDRLQPPTPPRPRRRKRSPPARGKKRAA